jgi:putative ABC transport system ATP-binding protein
MSAAPTCVELDGVGKAFEGPAGRVSVLAAADLQVEQGEIVAVAGRSGSGKTTLLTLVAGFERPDAGRVVVLGDELREPPSWRDVAVVPQSLAIIDELTVGENVALPARLAGSTDAEDDVDELLGQLGIDHLTKRFADEISLGEQQRVAVARAVAARPRVLVADEPISHQNEGWARTVMLVLERLADAGTACLLATHNAVAFESCHRVLELHDGALRSLDQVPR